MLFSKSYQFKKAQYINFETANKNLEVTLYMRSHTLILALHIFHLSISNRQKSLEKVISVNPTLPPTRAPTG